MDGETGKSSCFGGRRGNGATGRIKKGLVDGRGPRCGPRTPVVKDSKAFTAPCFTEQRCETVTQLSKNHYADVGREVTVRMYRAGERARLSLDVYVPLCATVHTRARPGPDSRKQTNPWFITPAPRKYTRDNISLGPVVERERGRRPFPFSQRPPCYRVLSFFPLFSSFLRHRAIASGDERSASDRSSLRSS